MATKAAMTTIMTTIIDAAIGDPIEMRKMTTGKATKESRRYVMPHQRNFKARTPPKRARLKGTFSRVKSLPAPSFANINERLTRRCLMRRIGAFGL